MSINFRKADEPELKPRIVVFGVGGAGGNAVSNMLAAQLQGVEFVAANTDAQALANSGANRRIQLGGAITQGLGAGSKPEVGAQAADASLDEIIDALQGCHMAFITAGMGGGTGTGAAPVIARAARDHGILTVGVVTKPFQFEGQRRMRVAEEGIRAMQEVVDTLIVIPNQNLFRIASDRTTFAEAFVLADQVLYSGVACIVDLIVKEGLINLDFADVRTVMSGMGSAMMGTGEASGEGRATRAAEEAITNPLLDDVSLAGAKGLLLSITGGDLTLYEVDEAASRVRQEVDPEANIIVGATYDPSLGDRVRVSIVASGMDRSMIAAQPPRSAIPVPPAMPAAPVMSGPSAQDRIGDALRPTAFEELAQAPNAQPYHSGAQPAQSAPIVQAPSWHAGDDIEITELSPEMLSGTFAPPPARYAAPQRPLGQTEDFAPAPPAKVRRPPSRIPNIEEFPPVGQREYHAKSQGAGAPSYTHPEQSGRAAPEPRKRSFFDRLTGRAKRDGDSREHGGQRASHETGNVSQSDRSYTVGRDAEAARSQWLDGERKREEKPDLPAFFTRSRR